LSAIYESFGGAEQKEFQEAASQEKTRILEKHHYSQVWIERLYKNARQNLSLVFEVADQIGVPAGVLLGIALEESAFNPNAFNKKTGVIGIMQLEKKTEVEWLTNLKKWAQENNDRKTLDMITNAQKTTANEDIRYQPELNLRLGAFGLRRMSYYFGGWDLGVMAYCYGISNTTREFKKYKNENPQEDRVTYLKLRRLLPEGKSKNYPIRTQAELEVFLEYILGNQITALKKLIENAS